MPRLFASFLHFIRHTRSGAALVASLVVIAVTSVPVHLALKNSTGRQNHLAEEAERHLNSRVLQAQTLLERSKSMPKIVALTIAQADNAPIFEETIRNLLAMSGIVDSVNIVSTFGPATVIQRDMLDQKSPIAIHFRPSANLVMVNKPFVGFGDGSLLIKEVLYEVDAQGNRRMWGFVTVEASFAYLIQELHLLSLVNDGFGVKLAVQWQTNNTEAVIFNGGDQTQPGMARSLDLPGNAVLKLTVMPPFVPLSGLSSLAWGGVLAFDLLLFLLTFHLIRRPQILERKVEERTQEIAAEKTALRKEIATRVEVEANLERSHGLLDSIFEHIPGMIVLRQIPDMRIVRINRSTETILEKSRETLIGHRNEEIFTPDLALFLNQGDTDALAADGLINLPIKQVETGESRSRWISYSKTVLRDREGAPNYILEFGEDLTERENLNHVLTVLSEINHTIIHTTDRNQLLQEARRILEEKGGFPAVWIHVKDGLQSTFVADPKIQDYAVRICNEIDNPGRKCWPDRRLHCETLHCCNHSLSCELKNLGLQSLIHLPLRSDDRIWGDIGILGKYGQRFSSNEQSLLDELAGNLSFALDAIHQEERRRDAERKLELSARVFESNSEGIAIMDADNKILMVNKAFSTLTGYSTEEVVGKTSAFLGSNSHDAELYGEISHTLEQTDEWHGELINRRKNGEAFPEWLNISVVRDETGRISNYVAVFSDLTARRQIEARVEFLAHYDPLTALPNRAHFVSRLTEALEQARESGSRVAIVYLDLDRFKLINETIGHMAADQVLLEISSRLVKVARNKQNVARLSGDHFALLIPDLESLEGADEYIKSIQSKLDQPFMHFNDQEIHISASIGISVFPEDGTDTECLIRNADSAMYAAITGGGNTYRFFCQAMNQNADARMLLESKLHHALERGEFAVNFQPFISTSSGCIAGAEALLRWHCPDLGGNVSPEKFIPVLEEIGLIKRVGEWVLDQACTQLKRWQLTTAGPLFVAVNISAHQLLDDLPTIVAKAIADHEINPSQLEIELTESAIMRDTEIGIRILHELKALGVQLSIDDFGTGYSSLSYLKRLPMSTLKIDRSFVIDLPNEDEAISIATAILALGRALHLHIIAEGVETQEQVEFLCKNGCDLLQGYFFSKPLTAGEFIRLLSSAKTFPLPTSNQRPLKLVAPGKRNRA